MYPTDLRYTEEHEWIAAKGTLATMGITEYAQHELGDIVYVELPEVGRQVQKGEVLGTIESVKAVSEVYAPAGGTVREVNAALNDRPELVNQDPHGEGWVCRLELRNPAELDRLMAAEAYEALVSKA